MFRPRIFNSLRQHHRSYSSSPGRIINGILEARIGSRSEMTYTYTQAEVSSFSQLSGDTNPIHVDAAYASTTPFGKPIVHGIYAASLFSTILGSSKHGSVYVSQSLQFLKPVFVDSTVRARIEVLGVEKRRRGHLLTCSSTVEVIQEGGTVVPAVVGEARVLIPFSSDAESEAD